MSEVMGLRFWLFLWISITAQARVSVTFWKNNICILYCTLHFPVILIRYGRNGYISCLVHWSVYRGFYSKISICSVHWICITNNISTHFIQQNGLKWKGIASKMWLNYTHTGLGGIYTATEGNYVNNHFPLSNTTLPHQVTSQRAFIWWKLHTGIW